MSPVQLGIIALIIANLIWGAASPVFKLALLHIPPFTLAFLRFFGATFIMGIALNRKLKLPFMPWRDGRMFLVYAICGISINVIFYFIGLKLTFAMNAPIIISSQPIMTFLFCSLILRESFRPRKVVGMLIGTVGMLLILLEPLLQKGMDGSITGNAALVIATVAAAAQTIAGTRVFPKYNPLNLMFWAFLIGTATFLPFAAAEFRSNPALYAGMDKWSYVGIIYGAVFSSTVAYTASAWGLSKIRAADASMFAYVDPIAGTTLAYVLLHEPITVPFVIGSIAIFGGIFIAEGRLHYHPLQRLKPSRAKS